MAAAPSAPICAEADGNKSQAARLLGLTRNALRYRLSQMGMDKEAGGGE